MPPQTFPVGVQGAVPLGGSARSNVLVKYPSEGLGGPFSFYCLGLYARKGPGIDSFDNNGIAEEFGYNRVRTNEKEARPLLFASGGLTFSLRQVLCVHVGK